MNDDEVSATSLLAARTVAEPGPDFWDNLEARLAMEPPPTGAEDTGAITSLLDPNTDVANVEPMTRRTRLIVAAAVAAAAVVGGVITVNVIADGDPPLDVVVGDDALDGVDREPAGNGSSGNGPRLEFTEIDTTGAARDLALLSFDDTFEGGVWFDGSMYLLGSSTELDFDDHERSGVPVRRGQVEETGWPDPLVVGAVRTSDGSDWEAVESFNEISGPKDDRGFFASDDWLASAGLSATEYYYRPGAGRHSEPDLGSVGCVGQDFFVQVVTSRDGDSWTPSRIESPIPGDLIGLGGCITARGPDIDLEPEGIYMTLDVSAIFDEGTFQESQGPGLFDESAYLRARQEFADRVATGLDGLAISEFEDEQRDVTLVTWFSEDGETWIQVQRNGPESTDDEPDLLRDADEQISAVIASYDEEPDRNLWVDEEFGYLGTTDTDPRLVMYSDGKTWAQWQPQEFSGGELSVVGFGDDFVVLQADAGAGPVPGDPERVAYLQRVWIGRLP